MGCVTSGQNGCIFDIQQQIYEFNYESDHLKTENKFNKIEHDRYLPENNLLAKNKIMCIHFSLITGEKTFHLNAHYIAQVIHFLIILTNGNQNRVQLLTNDDWHWLSMQLIK